MEKNPPIDRITCTVSMRFAPAELDRAINLMLSSVGRTQSKPGCKVCSVARDVSEGNGVRYTEEWDSQGAFERHLASAEFRCVLVAMDMGCEEPQVVVGNLSGHRGLAYLQELREKPGRQQAKG